MPKNNKKNTLNERTTGSTKSRTTSKKKVETKKQFSSLNPEEEEKSISENHFKLQTDKQQDINDVKIQKEIAQWITKVIKVYKTVV